MNSHEEFSKMLATKTPTELAMIRRNLKAGNALHKEGKIALVEKLILKGVK